MCVDTPILDTLRLSVTDRDGVSSPQMNYADLPVNDLAAKRPKDHRAHVNIRDVSRIRPGPARDCPVSRGSSSKPSGLAPRPRVMTWEQWRELLASRTHPGRLMTLAEMANVGYSRAADSLHRARLPR